jgi:hypothetical protein
MCFYLYAQGSFSGTSAVNAWSPDPDAAFAGILPLTIRIDFFVVTSTLVAPRPPL